MVEEQMDQRPTEGMVYQRLKSQAVQKME